MAKLYFKYGAMGASKTAQALMCKFNYEQKGFQVFLFKTLLDNRTVKNGKGLVHSRIGLESECIEFSKDFSFIAYFNNQKFNKDKSVIIVDECQFLTKEQVDELKILSLQIPVLCYGLLTNFKTELFEGSKRLVELAESLTEIKSVCRCGRKATINARFINGKIATNGEEVMIGADETYEGLCFACYKKIIDEK